MAIFRRLIGLETEYSLHIPSDSVLTKNRPQLFARLARYFQHFLPIVPAQHMKEGFFHAAGGAVWFETERPAGGGGLIEGATAECRSPRELIAQQRAQDELLAEATAAAFAGSEIRLLKNDRDAEDNIFGSQENYSAQVASGWRLGLWWVCLTLMLPIAVLTWGMLWILAGLVIAVTVVFALAYLVLERFWRDPAVLSKILFGCEFQQLGRSSYTGSAGLEAGLSVLTRVVALPLATVLWGAIWLTAFVPQRKKMLAFLVSRMVFGGSGMIDKAGRFRLASKGMAVNCTLGFGGLLLDRPIFSFGHFFKTAFADAWLTPGVYFQLFRRRQRMQLALGDSNLCDRSEYLRVATTALVLDCLEAGGLPHAPQLHAPIKALRQFACDPNLEVAVEMATGEPQTALAIQRFYLDACRRFVEKDSDRNVEAYDVLELWEETLDLLAEEPADLIGSIDWITKRHLLEHAASDADYPVRKKIDLRYHELSSEGYHARIREQGGIEDLLQPEEVERARRNPPAGTPATARARYIREFAGGDVTITANWQAVFLGDGKGRRVIPLGLPEEASISKPQADKGGTVPFSQEE